MTPKGPPAVPGGADPRGRGRLSPPPPSIVWAVGIAIIVLIVYLSRGLVLLLLFALGLGYIINPLVKRAEGAAVKRGLAVTGVFLGIGVSFLIAAYFLAPHLRAEVSTLYDSYPSFTKRLDETLDAVEAELVATYPAAHRLFPAREARYERLNNFIEEQTANLPGLVGHLATLVIGAVLVPLFAYFLLRDSPKIFGYVMDRLPPAHIETSVAVWCEIDRVIGRYLRGLAMDGLVIGAAASVGLWMLGVNYPLLLGAFSGLANVVPYLGPILGGGVSALVALMQFKSLSPVGHVLILYLVIKLFDDAVIQSLTIGKSVHLHPMLLVASVLAIGHAAGFIGMLLAVPAVTILQEVTKLVLERRRYRAGVPDRHRRAGVPIQSYVC